jgi:MFS family permease
MTDLPPDPDSVPSALEAKADTSMRALLKQTDFVFFWAARFVATLAVQIQAVTIGWQVYTLARETGHNEGEGAFLLGMVGLAQFIPLFFLTLTAGETADRHDRKAIMTAAIGVDILCAGGLGLLAWSGHTALWPIFAIAVLFGAGRAFLSPASSAMGPMLVPRPLLPRAIAWNSLSWQSASIIGPALGGLLCAISPATAFAASAGLFLVGGLCLLGIRQSTKPVVQPGSRWTLIKEGLVYTWRNKIVFGSISLDLFAVLLGGATALLPVFARDVLHVGAEGFGILRAAPAVGATGGDRSWPATDPPPRGPADVRRRGRVRRGDGGVRPVAVDVAVGGRPGWCWAGPTWSRSISARPWCSWSPPTRCAAASPPSRACSSAPPTSWASSRAASRRGSWARSARRSSAASGRWW